MFVTALCARVRCRATAPPVAAADISPYILRLAGSKA
jgi:hypothetical protein